MKFATYILLFAGILCSGCIREIGPCPPGGNATLTFRYIQDGQDVFGAHIGKVNLYIYRAGGEFVRAVEVSQEALDVFHGIEIDLPAGAYDIIGWGNIGPNTGVADTEGFTMEESYIFYSGPATGDSLYHSPGVDGTGGYVLTVPEKGSVSAVMDFTNRHKIIEVYVQGLVAPSAGVSELVPGYYFDMTPLAAAPKSMLQQGQAVTTPQGVAYLSRFYTPEFLNANPIQVSVADAAGTVGYTLSLQDYIAEFYPDLVIRDGGGETIRIMLRFTETSVSVSLPDWDYIDITPIF